MARLGVNIDHVATLRQARRGAFPDPVAAAAAAERAGADSITVHLREDRRHIQDADVRRLREKVRTKLNLEMACSEPILRIACRLRPDDVCLVPEKRQELTTEGGLDVAHGFNKIARSAARLKAAGIRVSLFVDPAAAQVEAAARAGADAVELHTGRYAAAGALQRKLEFRKLVEAGRLARRLGLRLNAGHGLDYGNAGPVAKIEGMSELNIGFAIIARSLFTGIESAVREMKKIIDKGC